MKKTNTPSFGAFRKIVYAHFGKEGRELPWRVEVTPYSTFVSEIMLQQTQVPRVAAIFPRFIRRFPGWKTLAAAELKDVFDAWQGLGYNRRAKFLHAAAQEVMARFGGALPDDPAALVTLPGVGKATAASIAAFGFNRPEPFIETNIRAVFIHHFYGDRAGVTDAELLPLVERALDRRQPRRWYSALMDYGTALKKRHGNPSRRSAHHKKQSRFEGSLRQVRGRIMKTLVADPRGMTAAALSKKLELPPERVKQALTALCAEKMLRRSGARYLL